MKNFIHRVPAFKYLVILTITIFGLSFFEFTILQLIIILFVSFIVISLLIYLKKFNLSYYLVVFSTALILSYNMKDAVINKPDKIIPEEKAIINGKIIKINKKSDDFIRLIIKGNIDTKNLPEIKKTKVLLTVFKTKRRNLDIKQGNKIFTNCTIELPFKGNLHMEFNEELYLKSKDIQWIGKTNDINFSIIEQSKNIYYYRSLITKNILRIIKNNYSEKTYGIAYAILTGDKSQIENDTRNYFSYTGTAHLLAVSGLHTGLIAYIFFLILSFLSSKWLKFILFVILLSLFVILTGFQPSTIRASLMIVFYLLFKILERPVEPLNIISSVAVINIIANPDIIYSIAFQLSVFSVFGIVIFFKTIYNKFNRIISDKYLIIKYLYSSLALTLSASIITIPLSAYYFNVFSLISPITNLIAIPIFILSVIYLIAGFSIYYIFQLLGVYYFSFSDILINSIVYINEFLSNFKFLYIENENSIIYAIGFTIISVYLIFSINFKNLIFRTINVALIIFILMIFYDVQEDCNKIYSRKYSTVIIDSVNKNKNLALIIDRKKYDYPKLDYGLFLHILNSDKKWMIGYTGDNGILMSDKLKNLKNIEIFEISNKMLKIIENKTKLNFEKYYN